MGGTARTLDEADGEIPLQTGVVSFSGWAVLDDSTSNTIRVAEHLDGARNPFGTWVIPKESPTTDIYLFGYGHRYREAVRDLYRLTGPLPLLPRFVFGNWWSRFHPYTADEYIDLLTRFEAEGIPLSVAVLDMDWHLVDIDPKYGSGRTGYTWNRELFPHPKEFLRRLHEHGLHTSLNVHPADGVRAHEIQYGAIARRMGIDERIGEAISFDLTSPRFMEAYLELIFHPMEDEGVDLWWLDWQQGSVTRQRGLDPLWMLNHLHYLDSARAGKRPLTLSRFAGPGSHRYPLGFSGDTITTWASLGFQPFFTATASNIGYGWWSHDIGGHMGGSHDEERAARWIQLGVFSPINRLHSNDSAFNGKEPWNLGCEARAVIDDALRLRHALIPYLYTMNRRASFDGSPLVEPMYWEYPENEKAYETPNQYRFGTQLIVAPVTEPMDPELRRGKSDVWLPQGTWFDFFDGRRYESRTEQGRKLHAWRALDRIPVFAPAGAIVPMQTVDGANAGSELNSVCNPCKLTVVVFPGADGSFTLWEDDGAQQDRACWAETELVWTQEGGAAALVGDERPVTSSFTISPVGGDTEVVPSHRQWTVVVRGIASVSTGAVHVRAGGSIEAAIVTYDEDRMSLSVTLPFVASTAKIDISISGGVHLADNPIDADAFALLRNARMLYVTKDEAYRLVREQGPEAIGSFFALEDHPVTNVPAAFSHSHMPTAVIEALSEVLFRS